MELVMEIEEWEYATEFISARTANAEVIEQALRERKAAGWEFIKVTPAWQKTGTTESSIIRASGVELSFRKKKNPPANS